MMNCPHKVSFLISYFHIINSYGHNVRIVHFIGTSKPWHIKFDNQGQPQPRLYEEHISQFLQQWWNIFHADVKPIMAKMVSFFKTYQMIDK